MVEPSSERKSTTRSGKVFGVESDSDRLPLSNHDVIDVDLDNKCKHGSHVQVKYDWTGANPVRWFACCYENEGMKCASFKWADSEWDARTLIVWEKLMRKKERVEAEARSWEQAWRIAKIDANEKASELHLMTQYYDDATKSLMNTRKKMRNDALMCHVKMGNDDKIRKAENDARMWKEECAKANKEVEATVAKLQDVKGHLDYATISVKKIKKLLQQAAYKRSFRKDDKA